MLLPAHGAPRRPTCWGLPGAAGYAQGRWQTLLHLTPTCTVEKGTGAQASGADSGLFLMGFQKKGHFQAKDANPPETGSELNLQGYGGTPRVLSPGFHLILRPPEPSLNSRKTRRLESTASRRGGPLKHSLRPKFTWRRYLGSEACYVSLSPSGFEACRCSCEDASARFSSDFILST